MEPPAPAPVTLRVHPPERGRRAGSITLACGCSCCCCCCLHSVGSLAGAAIGASLGRDVGDAAPSVSAVTLTYWIVTAFFTVGGVSVVATSSVLGGHVDEEAILLVLAVALMFLPAVQLFASLVAFVVALTRPSGHRGAALGRVGRITLLSLLGAIAGTALMAAAFTFLA